MLKITIYKEKLSFEVLCPNFFKEPDPGSRPISILTIESKNAGTQLVEHAKLVIIGAGIAGCSTAYHLSRLGWTDIIVLEQGELFQPGNSTSHAPGNIFQTNFSRTMTKFAQYSIDLFSKLELDGQTCYYPVGGMEIATTPDRLEDLKRKLGVAKSWGTDARLVPPEEACELLPLLDSKKILGAYLVSNDGVVKAVRASEAMAREAKTRGVRLIGGTRVTGIGISGKRVKDVITDKGSISAENVLICAGIWGPKVAKMIGMTLPLSPMEHLYTRTSPLKELEGEKREVVHPVLRHQDKSMYFRQHGDSYGIGSYNHDPLLIDAEDILPHGRAPIMPSIREFTPEHFSKARSAANDLMPALGKVDLVYKINGMFSFTIDGFPILGPWREVEGLWIAEAIWVMHSGGVGKVMAEWMVDGVPSLDLRECDVNRFHSYAFNVQYIKARAAQQYREVYDIIHPMQPIKYPRNLRLTPFHPRLEALGGEFFENAGWERPQWFRSNERFLSGQPWPVRSGWEARFWSPAQGFEHVATRTGVAVYDMTPFTKLEVTGPGSLGFLQYLCANNVDVPESRVVYTSMLNSKGGIVCDLTVTRLGEERFLVITGGTMGMHDLAWMMQHVTSGVSIVDVSSSYCCLGLWGPRAKELLEKLSNIPLSISSFKPFTAKRFFFGDVPVWALRVSYVGEDGWEIYTETGYGLTLWDTLWEVGREFGLIPAGGAAFDSLRLEKGYRLWGSDIHSEYNPLEAGLDFAVRLDKGDFLGRDALLKIKDNGGVQRKLSRMYFDEPGRIVMGKEPIIRGEKTVGYVTSSTYGYSIGKGIAYGYLPIELATAGTGVEVYYFGKIFPARVVS